MARLGVPWVATPMGKGVVADDDVGCVQPARSLALQRSDCVILAAARLNWILHFGRPPRFQSQYSLIQIDTCPEEMHQNKTADAVLCGDVAQALAMVSLPSTPDQPKQLSTNCRCRRKAAAGSSALSRLGGRS